MLSVRSLFMCFVWFLDKTVIFSSYTISVLILTSRRIG